MIKECTHAKQNFRTENQYLHSLAYPQFSERGVCGKVSRGGEGRGVVFIGQLHWKGI